MSRADPDRLRRSTGLERLALASARTLTRISCKKAKGFYPRSRKESSFLAPMWSGPGLVNTLRAYPARRVTD